MDRLTRNREAVRAALLDWHQYISRGRRDGIDAECVFDEPRDNYLITYVGWHNGKRMLSGSVFIRIRDGKVWVEEDWSKHGIVEELERRGVPREDIVLAFHPPELRHLTDYAAA